MYTKVLISANLAIVVIACTVLLNTQLGQIHCIAKKIKKYMAVLMPNGMY